MSDKKIDETVITPNEPTQTDLLREHVEFDEAIDGSKPLPSWAEGMLSEAWNRAKTLRESARLSNQKFSGYVKYQNDPVKFGREVLGYGYTREIEEVMESVRDNPVTLARSANAVGKSFGAATVALWFYLVYPDSKVYLTAAPPVDNLRRILWGEIGHIVEQRPELFIDHKKKATSMERHKQSFITCVAIPMSGSSEERQGKFSGKHAPHLLFIVDEGDAVPEEVYWGIEACNTGGMVARLLVLFNPRAKAGPIYAKERDHTGKVIHISALTHPNVVQGRDVIPGAVTRDTVIRRFNIWTRDLAREEKPDSECVKVPDFLVGKTTRNDEGGFFPALDAGYRKVTEPAFWYMVLGEYPAQSEQQLISQAHVEAAMQRWKDYVAEHGEIPPVGIRPIMGLDVAEYGVDSSFACLRYGDYVPMLHPWKGLDPDAVASEAMEFYFKHNAQMCRTDGQGVGAGVSQAMVRRAREKFGSQVEIYCIGVKISERPSLEMKSEMGEFSIMRDQIWWAVREWLKTPTAMLPPDPFLSEELIVPKYEIRNGKIIITSKQEMRKKLHRSPDRADALCLTFAPVYIAKVVGLDGRNTTTTE